MVVRDIRVVGFQIDAQGRAFCAGAGQAVDDARAVGEDDADALACADRAIDRVGVAEVVAEIHGVTAEGLAGQGGEAVFQVLHHAVGGVRRDGFEVVA